MTSKFTELAIDCADPSGLARFWCSVLGYEVQDEDDGLVSIGSPMAPEGKNHLGPVPPTLTFARVPEGKTAKNRLHLDVNPTDRDQDDLGRVPALPLGRRDRDRLDLNELAGIAEHRDPQQCAGHVMVTEDGGDLVPGGHQVIPVTAGDVHGGLHHVTDRRAGLFQGDAQIL